MKTIYYVIELDGGYFQSRNFLDRFNITDDIKNASTFDNYFDARDLATSLNGKLIRLKSNVDK